MVQYFCQNCNDLMMKSVPSVLEHAFKVHGIEVTRTEKEAERAEDAHSTSRRTVACLKGFRCEECDLPLDYTIALLKHLDHSHGVHIWYEKGLTRKRVYFDGILDDSAHKEANQREQNQTERKYTPISQRPFEPRKRSDTE
jgi:hypothetical protein